MDHQRGFRWMLLEALCRVLDGYADGLNTGHAYTVMGGKQVGDKRYVLLRSTKIWHYFRLPKESERTFLAA